MRPRLARMVNGAFMVKRALPSREPVKPWGIGAAVRDGLASGSCIACRAAKVFRRLSTLADRPAFALLASTSFAMVLGIAPAAPEDE